MESYLYILYVVQGNGPKTMFLRHWSRVEALNYDPVVVPMRFFT